MAIQVIVISTSQDMSITARSLQFLGIEFVRHFADGTQHGPSSYPTVYDKQRQMIQPFCDKREWRLAK
jgi:hypothetical protein